MISIKRNSKPSYIHYSTLFTIGLLLIFITQNSYAKVVLGNFNQPTRGLHKRVDVNNWVSVPFTTDSNYTVLKQVDLDVNSSVGGNSFVVQIRDTDSNGHPGNLLKKLSGPTSPNGFASYVGHVALNANTSYFVVMGADILGIGFYYEVSLINGSSADSGEDTYQFGTDTNSDGNADIKNVCSTTSRVNWDCNSSLLRSYYSKIRVFADAPAVPRVSLSNTAINFGNVAIATNSFQVLTITNSGNSDLVLGNLLDDNLFIKYFPILE
jgi:hypothetical protein